MESNAAESDDIETDKHVPFGRAGVEITGTVSRVSAANSVRLTR